MFCFGRREHLTDIGETTFVIFEHFACQQLAQQRDGFIVSLLLIEERCQVVNRKERLAVARLRRSTLGQPDE